MERPSSTSKPPRAHDSLTLRNDGSSSARIPNRRPVPPSASAGSPLMQVETPYDGPTGPSHPYNMYPQRTFSNASASTVPRINRQSYDGPRGPTHPYALYTQNTTTNDEADQPTSQSHIPVGFSGMGASYQRQIGPDGEEAGDLIGPLGHLEELPPYTRYPEDPFARKSPEPMSDPSSSSPIQPIPGAGGIGMATRDPEFSSAEDDLGMPSRPPSRAESNHEVNTAAREYSEKKRMTKWQRRARKKLWGIVPYWSIFLLLVSIVIMGVVMGAVIGTVLVGHDRGGPAGDEQPDTEPSVSPGDVKPLNSIPDGLCPLPTGYYSLPPLDTSQAPKSCFSDPTQAQAWSCDMPFRFYSLNIHDQAKQPKTSAHTLTLTAFKPSSAKFIWGTQPPDVPEPQTLQLVNDNFEKGRGPAWWLSLIYNKTVIVPEDAFPGQKTKRDWHYFDTPMAGIDPSKFKKKNVGAKDGDKPWICTWPNTSLEIFIYANQNASTPSPTRGTPTATPSSGTDNATGSGDATPDYVPAYPKVVKFLERRYSRVPNSTATCRQVQITDGGRGVKDLVGADGQPIVVTVQERRKGVDETLTEHDRYGQRDKRFATNFLSREALEMTDCGCLWWST